MGFVKGLLLISLSSTLILLVFMFGILWSVNSFLYPQIYEKVLNDSGAYNMINVSQLPGGSFIKIPSGGVEALSNNLLESTLSYLRGDSMTLNLTLEIDNQKLNDFFLSQIEQLPTCTLGENPLSGNDPVCIPPGVNASQYLDSFIKEKNFTIVQGGSVNLADVLGLKDPEIANIKEYVMYYQYVLYGTFLLTVLISIRRFFVSDYRTLWSGISLIIGGSLVFLLGFLAFPFALSNIPSEISFVQSVSKDLADYLYMRITNYTLAAVGVGFIGVILSPFIRRKKKEAEDKNPKRK
jgi:hypothetical protein